MRVSRAQAALHRERIVDEAARLFRERGFDGISVADLMRAAGLTHGAFYGHFPSKQALMGAACKRAVGTMLAEWEAVAASSPERPLDAVVAAYLSARHRDEPGTGCLMAAVGPEASRQSRAVRKVVTECLEDVLDFLTRCAPGRTPTARRQTAVATFASLVGALIVARAVSDVQLSDEMLNVARRGHRGR
jgi:TetR/AcrR family transcriptional repressor of nem operon